MIGPVACLLLGVALILFLLLYLRLHPFLALTLAALIIAVFSDRIPPDQAIGTVASGFADLMGKIGILLIMAAIIGKCLVDSGAADRIIRSFCNVFGEGKEHLSFLVSGFILSMPVFFDTVFYLLAPLVRAAYARRKKDYALMICAAAAGGAVTHALVPPTPGPVVVSQALQVPIGLTFMVGTLASVVPVAIGGFWYSRFINRRLKIHPQAMFGVDEAELEAKAARPEEELPSLAASLLPVVVPILLISMSTVSEVFFGIDSDNTLLNIFGDKDVAFVFGALLAVLVVLRQSEEGFREIFAGLEPAISSGAMIAFITCAGGAFGAVLTRAGVGDVIAHAAQEWGISLLVLAFVGALLIRVAQGSATVAMITTAGIVSPALSTTQLDFNPVYLVCVIGFGATAASWMNDSGFWIVSQLTGMTEGETLKTWTVLLTVMAFAGFLWVLLLSKLLPLV